MTNKAFLVGVNKYEMLGSNLQGCVNDITNVRDVLLKYYGLAVKDIRVLADTRATKNGILDRLHWLVKDAKAGDRLLFHFSGHGSQIRDWDGDEVKDHLDEIIENDLPVSRMLKTSAPTSHALFAGCKDNQTSADAQISGAYNGAFTYYLCKHIRDTQGAGRYYPPRETAHPLTRLRASLRHEGYDRRPQLECPSAWKKKKVLA